MLLINKRTFDDLKPDHPARLEYRALCEQILEDFGEKGTVVLERPDFPRRDPKTGHVMEAPPMTIPLETSVSPEGRGKETWSYCKGMPQLLPNGLYELTVKNLQVAQNIPIDVHKDIDLAVFLLKKSLIVKSGQLVLQNPGGAAKKQADGEREQLELSTAIYTTLADDKELRMVASAWGVDGAHSQTPDEVRLALQSKLLEYEKQKKSNPNVRGIKEFISSLKDRDTLIAADVLKRLVDSKKISYDAHMRKYSVGSREIVMIPLSEATRPFAYLCRYLDKNKGELNIILKETVTNEMLDAVDDYTVLVWYAKLEDLPYFKMKKDDLLKALKEAFCA